MDIKQAFKKYDPMSEAEWHEYNEMKFLIAPAGNPLQKKRMTELFTLKEAITLEEDGAVGLQGVKANVAVGRIYELYSQSIVLDWDKVEEEGKPLKFSSEKIHEWMMEFSEFGNWVTSKSAEVRNNRNTAKEELIKN